MGFTHAFEPVVIFFRFPPFASVRVEILFFLMLLRAIQSVLHKIELPIMNTCNWFWQHPFLCSYQSPLYWLDWHYMVQVTQLWVSSSRVTRAGSVAWTWKPEKSRGVWLLSDGNRTSFICGNDSDLCQSVCSPSRHCKSYMISMLKCRRSTGHKPDAKQVVAMATYNSLSWHAGRDTQDLHLTGQFMTVLSVQLVNGHVTWRHYGETGKTLSA